MTGQRYSTSVDTTKEVPVYTLGDAEALADAQVVPALGHNCFAFHVTRNGVVHDVLSSPASFDALRKTPAHWGIPILFPYPNRIRRGVFPFRGGTIDLHTPTGGNAIHGSLLHDSWRVVSVDADADSAWIEADGSTVNLPDVLEHWPFPFDFRVTYRLKSGALWVEAVAKNVGDRPMPFGYGIHPYFNVPFTQGSTPAECEALVPAARRWVNDAEFIPIGEIEDVTGDRDLRQYRRVDQIRYDDLFTGLTTHDGWSECRLRDRRAGAEVYVRSDDSFREIVVFSPPWHSAICFEPYTCATDAFNLAARGLDSGMRVLDPGQTWSGMVEIGIRAAS